MDRRRLLERALRRHGTSDPAQLESHIRGCDLAFPVTAEVLNRGAILNIWVRDGGSPGKYAAPEGEDPQRLGIMIRGRHKEVYRVLENLSVIRCTAATFPMGLVDKVGGWGGGTQFLLPPDWLDVVERIS